MKKCHSILFMGTPDFAVPSLIALYENSYNILGVVTQPDAPIGRKKQYVFSPVKQKAIALGIKIFQPKRIKEILFIEQIRALNPDCFIVAAYGKILPKELLSIPNFGSLNVHASILPEYRGASPIQGAIANGESQTGVTIMKMDEGLDTGPIFDIQKVSISHNDTAKNLQNTLSLVGAKLLIHTLDRYFNGLIKPIPQEDARATYTKILQKEDGRIDFNKKTATSIYNALRAYDPWPGIYAYLNATRIKFLEIDPRIEEIFLNDLKKNPQKIGELVTLKNRLFVQCQNDSFLEIKKIQLEGKKPISTESFINGYNPSGNLLT